MRSLLMLCAVAPLFAQPSISTGGIVNAASYSPAGLPNSAIAQGSLFLAFGTNLGPVSLVSAGFPLTSNLSGTSAAVTVNGTTVSPLIVYTSAPVVAMLLPSSVPTGTGTITVSYGGQSSQPAPIEVAAASFGIFTINQGGSGPAVVTDAGYAAITLTHAANPGETVALWGTGLGKTAADESQPQPVGNIGNVPTVWVGSRQASVSYWGRSPCCSGLDQINFQVPAGVTGCFVSVAVQTGGVVSNFGSIAVAASGRVCSEPSGLSAAQLSLAANGQSLNVATLSLSRSVVKLNLPPQTTITETIDSGSASFLRYTPAQLLSSDFGQAASVGSCTVFATRGNAIVADPVQPAGLDAGATVQLGGTNGTVDLKPVSQSKGVYSSVLSSGSAGPFFLDVPGHTFNVYGGADVGVLAQEVRMPPALSWTNQDSIATITESQGVTVNWSNAVPNGYVRVTGYSLSADGGNFGAGASFFCTADAGTNGTGQFTVPAAVLLSLPPTGSSGSTPGGFLGIASSQHPSDPFTGVRGIDAGFVSTSWQVGQNVTYAK